MANVASASDLISNQGCCKGIRTIDSAVAQRRRYGIGATDSMWRH